jgi:hypothetical protein
MKTSEPRVERSNVQHSNPVALDADDCYNKYIAKRVYHRRDVAFAETASVSRHAPVCCAVHSLSACSTSQR